ncbi:MAG: T9SS type A sorting domain-containing protein, partial [Candidatus Kapaibacteriota bacterium]
LWRFTHIFQICSQYSLFSSKEDEQGLKQTVFVWEKLDSAHQNFQEYEVPRFWIALNKSTSFESYSFDVFFKLDSPDSTFPLVLYDKLFGKYALYFAKIRPCVEINIPRTNSKDLYVGKIYPNPANRKDIVNFRIYSNHLDKIETLSINAYDILGREVANSSSFRISQIGNHFVDVELEINALSPGVYIIVASMDGMVSSNAVVIY